MAKKFKGKVPKGMTWKIARIILHEGAVRGTPLTTSQRQYFGALFSYLKPAGLSLEAAKRQALATLKKKKKIGKKKAAKRTLKKKVRKCKVCHKPIKQAGPGRPRLRHERCK